MKDNNNRIIYRDGKRWVNHRIDGRGPDTTHNNLNVAIERAVRNIKKHGNGHLKVRDENDETMIRATIKK